MRRYESEKVKMKEIVSGFTERDLDSKALLNTDVDSLLRYKIQKKKLKDINNNKDEIDLMKMEVQEIKNDLCEIKELLLAITNRR